MRGALWPLLLWRSRCVPVTFRRPDLSSRSGGFAPLGLPPMCRARPAPCGVVGRAAARGLRGQRWERAAARRIVKGRHKPPSSYVSLSTYLLTADQRGDGLHLPTATHSGAREAQLCARAVGYQAYHRADRPSRALRAAHAGTAAWYECACLWLGI